MFEAKVRAPRDGEIGFARIIIERYSKGTEKG